MKAFHRVSEVQEILNLGRTKTYDMIRAGVIPSVEIDGNIRVPVKEFNDFLEKLVRASEGRRAPDSSEPIEAVDNATRPRRSGTKPSSSDSNRRIGAQADDGADDDKPRRDALLSESVTKRNGKKRRTAAG
jgi:excisionase family DNA binding protein